MKTPIFVSILFVVLLVCQPKTFAEVTIRQMVSVSDASQKKLAHLIAKDKEAQARWTEVKKEADALLREVPRPLAVIAYEGLLDTDPARIKTEAHLRDMDKIAVLGYAYAATSHAAYRDKIKEFVLAWVDAFQPTGNPINEGKLKPVFIGYKMTRDCFLVAEKTQVETWLGQIAALEIESGPQENAPSKPKDNWHAKRLNHVGTIGFILNDKALIDYALQGFKQYVANSLFADGSSYDLVERDALSYHNSTLKPLLELAIAAAHHGVTLDGVSLYDYQAPSGSSLRRSVEFIVPYSNGVKTRAEWRNTKNDLDRRRAAAGLGYYQPGKRYDPQDSLEPLELASFFDPSLVRLVSMLRKNTAVKYPSWLVVLTDVSR